MKRKKKLQTASTPEKHRTRSSFQVLALSPVVFGCQFDYFYFVGDLIIFPWIRKDFT